MSSAPNTAAEATKMIKDASVFLLDIEGTTTSISFVKDTLFPYVRENLSAYLKENWSEASFQETLKKLVEQSKADIEAKLEGAIALDDEEESAEKAQEAVKNSVLWMMDSDRKVGALKQLQGSMYVKGYEKGDLNGHLYDDVVPQLRKWTEAEKKIYIFSSGSVEAQKLLFGNSVEGDITKMIADYFDTEVGPKVEKESYVKIAEKVGKPVGEILFFTDVVKEAEAAKEAGLAVVLLEREGNSPLSDEDKTKYTVISSFKLEEPEEEEVPAKKPKLDEEAVATEEKPTEEKEEEKKEETKVEDVEMKAEETEEAKENGDKKEEVDSKENGEEEEKKEVNGTNGVHQENGTNGTEEKTETNGVSNGDAKTEETVSEKTVSPTKKVVTEETAEEAPEVTAE
ncbi:enolase-phosphatase E1 [Neocloeon triangulifer]|uniref:enolase-phosphatase E1 n=1 Tax=Neocloeon triangulifer TaxID=2078957 RepID=UPI00286F24E6|nr:enolase-phosphatase E1 [Neocloeon triangulifer]